MSAELRVKLLGPPAAFVGNDPVSGFISIKAQALLFYLAATGETHRRDALAALLWSDVPDSVARKNLRDVLYNLRQLIGPFLIITRHEAGLNPAAPTEIDSHYLLQTVTTVRDTPSASTNVSTNDLQTLAAATDPHTGEFLAGFYAPDAPLFEEWMLAEREHLRLELGHALERLTDYTLSFGDYAAAETYARRQLELDSYREIAHRQLMTALALSGRRAQAVAHYETLVALLANELDLQPAPKTQQLFAKIRAGETISITLTGKHALPSRNLPLQLTSFVGRERELAEIKRLLKNTRFLTLTGPGGSGKTRLAIEIAVQTAGHYADGATFVFLASTKNPQQVINTVARELNLVERLNRSFEETLQRYLAYKHKLLILDNFEHLLPAAPLVTDLLRFAPQLTILVTSREALHLSGEHQYLVPPLALSDMAAGTSPSALLAVDAINLFVQRARMVTHDFALTRDNVAAVVSICRRLDGLPLAIELAAARIKFFSPQDLLQKLDDRLGLLVDGPRDVPRRQQALKATIEWSFNLLPTPEQQLFTQLAVFNGGRTLAAVEAVCACTKEYEPRLGLESLLNKNLLYSKQSPSGERRFYMLETIHEYARDRLCTSGEEQQIRERHLDYYLHLVEEMASCYMRQGQIALFERTDAEMDNIKAAIEWAIHTKKIDKAARLLTAINYYLRYRSKYVVEGYRLSKQLLPHLEQISPRYRLPFLISTSELAFHNNDLLLYRQLAQQAQTLARELGDKDMLAWSLALSIDDDGNIDAVERAVKIGQETLSLFRQLDNKPGMAYALIRLGEIYRLHGNLNRAKKAYNESLALCRQTGEMIREDMLKSNLSAIAYEQEDYGQAKSLLMSVINKEYKRDWMHWNIFDFALLSSILACLDQPERAVKIRGACHHLRSELGLDDHPYEQSLMEQTLADIKSRLDKSTFARVWAEGQRMTYEQLRDYVLVEEEEPKT